MTQEIGQAGARLDVSLHQFAIDGQRDSAHGFNAWLMARATQVTNILRSIGSISGAASVTAAASVEAVGSRELRAISAARPAMGRGRSESAPRKARHRSA